MGHFCHLSLHESTNCVGEIPYLSENFFDKSRYFLPKYHSTLVPVNVYQPSGTCNVSLEEVRETTFTIS